MAAIKVPIALNKGLDLASPAMSKEPGSLIDCLNYEFTTIDGTRRLDGYERYDGWYNGASADYWGVVISVLDASAFGFLQAGDLLKKVVSGVLSVLGVVVSYSSVTGTLIYVPVKKELSVLQPGDQIIVDSDAAADATVSAQSAPRYQQLSHVDFLAEVRTSSALLRQQVADSPHEVVGLHWLRNNLLEIRDAPYFTFNGLADSALEDGMLFRYNGYTYMVIQKLGSPLTVFVEPYGTAPGAPSTNVVVVGKDGSVSATYTPSSTVSAEGGDWAYMVAMPTPTTTGEPHVDQRMMRSVILTFTAGTRDTGIDPAVGEVVAIGTGANNYKAVIKSIVLVSGAWATSNAVGRLEVVPMDPLSSAATSGVGAKNTVLVGDAVVGQRGGTIFTVSSIIRTRLAGSKRLRSKESHYLAKTYNFYGTQQHAEAYGASGASRAFWAKYYVPDQTNQYLNVVPIGAILDNYSYGNIVTDTVENNDMPKWVSLHSGNRLALSWEGGDFLLSVVGEPYNFSGFEGAFSDATGDEITGMLEGVEDSTIVFGRRSIRRVVGNTNESMQVYTISGNSGAFPYTCVLVGKTPVFTEHTGISTLEQSETYSDFAGVRMSKKVDAELRPRLLAGFAGTETGGTYCAIGVRNKNQYRLFLKSGKVYSMCITEDGPAFGTSNYSNDLEARVPFAWSTEIQDSGRESIHVVWDSFLVKASPSGTSVESTPLTAAASPNPVFGSVTGSFGTSTSVTSATTTVTPSGGTGAPKNYTWSFVSGSTLTVNSPTSATTTFSSSVNQGTTVSAIYRCTVSDGTYTTTVDVTVNLQYQTSVTPLTASASPTTVAGSVTGTASTATVTSASTTVTPANGTGASKTYSWARISGDTLNITSPNSASTTFSSLMNIGTTKSAVYRCTVSDGTYTATADVTINLNYINGTQPLTASASPSSVSDLVVGSYGQSTTVTSNATTVSTANGSGGAKTYSWSKVSGDTVTVTSPTSNVTTFSATVAQFSSKSAVYRCTVNDGTYTATTDVDIYLEYSGST